MRKQSHLLRAGNIFFVKYQAQRGLTPTPLVYDLGYMYP